MSDVLEIRARPDATPLALRHADLQALPASEQVPDVGALVPGRRGRAVRLAALLERIGAGAGGRHAHVASRDPSFAVSVPLEELAGALVVYELGGAPLPPAQGGPFRLLVPGHPDECVHVKQLARLELADVPGRDTRPTDDAAHAALHKKSKP
ncbi:MAG: molybdopterin-dependent oxidoreductase [Planctomycetes bacterium]|nr:molybdopterin-dependent oxidoreductase [Planctomycetota bacterium]